MSDKDRKDGFLRRVFRSALLLLNIGAIIWLSLCALASIISPEDVRFLQIFSLSTAMAIVANLFFIVFWLLFSKKRWRALLSIITLVVCYQVSLTVFGLNYFTESDLANADDRVKLITWNVHGMDIFNGGTRDTTVEQGIIDLINREDADVVCLPEFPKPQHDTVDMRAYAQNIIERTGLKHHYYQFDNTLGTTIYFGTAIFTKHPLVRFTKHQLAEYTYLLQGDMLLPDSSIMSMYFVHLNTFGLSDGDKAYIEKVRKRNTSIRTDVWKSRTFVWKFNQAFAKRAKEADSAMLVIAQSKYPVLICGDFNEMPGSYVYTTFKGELQDAFIEKGRGLGRSYNQIFPTIRIDHVFYDSSALQLLGIKTPYSRLSDHNPIIANFKINSKPKS